MEPIAKAITPGAERMFTLAQALLKDVPDDRFARYAAPGGETVQANHPAFIYGHLALYPQVLFQAAGLDPAPVAVPESYQELFAVGVECKDDPDGSVYPSRSEIVGHFTGGHRALIDAASGLSDDALAAPHKLEGRFAEAFPTLGEAVSFMLLGHTMMHLGQMSTWRRASGLGSAF